MARALHDRRSAPRAEIALRCTLHRRTGSPVDARTVEVGSGGMSVSSVRPLTPDEILVFDLPAIGTTLVTGQARVLREQAHHVYALRFERLLEPVRAALYEMAASDSDSPEPQAG